MESIITASIDLRNQSIEFEKSDNFSDHLYVSVKIKTDSVVMLNDTLSINARLVSEKGAFEDFVPKMGEVYDQTSGGVFHKFYFDIVCKIAYTLELDFQFDGKLIKGKLDFIADPPPCPNAGWIWQDDSWKSPVPYPTDGKLYLWNNEQTNWVLGPDELQV